MVYLNGEFVPEEKAKVAVADRGFLYGDGLFETMRAYAGQVFRLDEHLERLFSSAKTIEIPLRESREELQGAIDELLKLNGLKDAYLRLTLTRGVASTPTLVVVAKPFTQYTPDMYESGFKAVIVGRRRNELSPLSGIKSLNFLDNILAKREAERAGVNAGIFLNTRGEVAEGAVSNIFIVKGEKLITSAEDSGILLGITRGVVLELAKKLKIPSFKKCLKPSELMDADEAFLTNSLMEIMPLVEVDGSKIGSGNPGRLTKLLHGEYKVLVKEES